jgi:hypothetical protein
MDRLVHTKSAQLAAAGLLAVSLAACAGDSGNGTMVPGGACVDNEQTWHLDPGETIGIGGEDVGHDWSGDGADVLKIKNEGDGKVELRGSDGELSLLDKNDGGSSTQVVGSGDDDGKLRLTLGTSPSYVTYSEDGETLEIQVSAGDNDVVTAGWSQDCADD